MLVAKEYKKRTVGDAAVEGLIAGIIAGIVMLTAFLALEFVAGVSPAHVLEYFDARADTGGAASPWVGTLTHLAVSGIYGLMFGIVTLSVARAFGARMNLLLWLSLGAVYGLLLLGVAQWVILPQTHFPPEVVPTFAFGLVHVLYGLVLAWLMRR